MFHMCPRWHLDMCHRCVLDERNHQPKLWETARGCSPDPHVCVARVTPWWGFPSTSTKECGACTMNVMCVVPTCACGTCTRRGQYYEEIYHGVLLTRIRPPLARIRLPRDNSHLRGSPRREDARWISCFRTVEGDGVAR